MWHTLIIIKASRKKTRWINHWLLNLPFKNETVSPTCMIMTESNRARKQNQFVNTEKSLHIFKNNTYISWKQHERNQPSYWTIKISFSFFFKIFYFFFNFKIFNSYMRSQTWTPLPPPSPQHLSGSSPCTSPKHAAPYVRHGLAIQFLHDSINVIIPILPNHPTLSLSLWVQKSGIHICVFFPVLHTGLSLPSS